jgi:CheY-like chemotaxis protein
MPIRIVLIEDNPGDSAWFQITLDECHLNTVLTIYSGGASALAALESVPEADILVVDWYLPAMEPRELLDHLREIPAFAHTPIAVFVPKHEEARLIREWYGGRLHIVFNPIDCDQLTAILKTMGGMGSAA